MIPSSVAHGLLQETNKVNHLRRDVDGDEKMISVVVQQQEQVAMAEDQSYIVSSGGGPLNSMATLADSLPTYPRKENGIISHSSASTSTSTSTTTTGFVGQKILKECNRTDRDDASKVTLLGTSTPDPSKINQQPADPPKKNVVSANTEQQCPQPTRIVPSSSSQDASAQEKEASSSSSSPDQQQSETNETSTETSSSSSQQPPNESSNMTDNKNDKDNVNTLTSNAKVLRSSLKQTPDENINNPTTKQQQQHPPQQQRRQRRRHHHVSFSTVHIRRYPMLLGDNPAVFSGPPVTLGWEYEVLPEMSLIDFETFRIRSRRLHSSHLVLSHYKRIEIIQRCGHTEQEIKAVEKEISKIRRQRNMSVAMSPFSTVQNLAESAGRKVRRGFGVGRRRKKT